MARRTLTPPETQDWAAYASHVRPLPGRTIANLPVRTATATVTAAPPPASPPPPVASKAKPGWTRLEIGQQPGGVDNATWRRLRTGRVPVTYTLDLHGLTAQRAFHALEHMLRHAQAEHARCVEIITGRGSGEGGGVLRRELPLWLNLPHLRPMVLAATYPHAANTGATRVLLRKPHR